MAMSLKEAIEIIESGTWFSISFITADVNKGAGGKVITIPRAKIARQQPNEASESKDSLDTKRSRRNPNHNLHFTRNIELENKNIRKIHPILVTHVNDQAIL